MLIKIPELIDKMQKDISRKLMFSTYRLDDSNHFLEIKESLLIGDIVFKFYAYKSVWPYDVNKKQQVPYTFFIAQPVEKDINSNEVSAAMLPNSISFNSILPTLEEVLNHIYAGAQPKFKHLMNIQTHTHDFFCVFVDNNKFDTLIEENPNGIEVEDIH